jgi:hypothetical protein
MSTSDKGYQSVINGLDGVCESFRTLVDQADFEHVLDNIASVSKQSNSQEAMLEILREEIEALKEQNRLLQCENASLNILYRDQTVFVRGESGSSDGTEDGKGSGEESEEESEEENIKDTENERFRYRNSKQEYASTSGTEEEQISVEESEEDIEEENIGHISQNKAIVSSYIEINDKVFVDEEGSSSSEEKERRTNVVRAKVLEDLEEMKKQTVRTQVIDGLLRQLGDNVFVNENLVTPQFKSRDFNTDNNLLNEGNFYQLIEGFLNNPTVEPFQQPEGYPVQMKYHSWWDDELHDFKGKLKKYLDYLEEKQTHSDNLEERRKLVARNQVIDGLLRQLGDNVFLDENLITPHLMSRDLNQPDKFFLSEKTLQDLIQRFAFHKTVEQFQQPKGYTIQMKNHSWWEDVEHNFKEKMIFFMQNSSDADLNIRQAPIPENMWP